MLPNEILPEKVTKDRRQDLDININGLLNDDKLHLFRECLKKDDSKDTTNL
jgi:hypothetical protein